MKETYLNSSLHPSFISHLYILQKMIFDNAQKSKCFSCHNTRQAVIYTSVSGGLKRKEKCNGKKRELNPFVKMFRSSDPHLFLCSFCLNFVFCFFLILKSSSVWWLLCWCFCFVLFLSICLFVLVILVLVFGFWEI